MSSIQSKKIETPKIRFQFYFSDFVYRVFLSNVVQNNYKIKRRLKNRSQNIVYVK